MLRTPFSLIIAALFVLPVLMAGPAASASTPESAVVAENPYLVSPTTVYAKGEGVTISGGGSEGRPFGSRTVNWGHGVDQEWAHPRGSGPTYHVYNKPGTYTPVVNEYINGEWVTWTLETVTVIEDTTAPVITFAVPNNNTVEAWSPVALMTSDNATGATPRVRIYQKRGDKWFGFQSPDWVEKSTKAEARKVAQRLYPEWRNNAATKWRQKVYGLARGHLYIEITARDRAGNHAKPVHHDVRIR